MGQYNLISSCLKEVKRACFGVPKLPFIGKWLENKYLTSADVNADHLQEKILRYIKEQGNAVDKNDDVSSYYKHDIFLTQRGGFVLERYKFTDIYWCPMSVEFVDSLIIWHIAIDICYYGDLDDKYEGDVRKVLNPKCKISKCLSDYMCYLLVFCLSMLPKGISEIRYKETCAEVTTLLKQKRVDDISSESKAWKALLQKYEEANKVLLEKYKDSSVEELFDMKDSQSLLKQACFLYMLLQQRVRDDYEKKWEIISAVWVEMLAYTAHHCEWREHAQQLRKGGELLTYDCFLVAHFGDFGHHSCPCPDTITAYSLEDNEFALTLTFIAIPIFITGIIKYGERTFMLRSSNAQRFKNSLLSNPDPGTDFIHMETTEERRKQQVLPPADQLREILSKPAVPKPATVLESESLEKGASDLQVAYFLFQRFQYLFADSILGTRERKDSCSLIENKSSEDAFKLIAIELGFIHLLYTKATIVYSPLGILFRVISFIASVTALVLFSVIIDIHAYSSMDVSITYILLIGAVVLEVYAFCVLLFSDWTALWYAGIRKTNHSSICCATFPCHSILANRNKWSRSMAQYNLVSSCLHKVQPRWFGVQMLPWIGDLLEKYQCLSWEDVDKDIEEMIFKQLIEKSNEIKDDLFNIESCRILLAKRGDYVLEKKYVLHDQFSWSTTTVEFDHSLLLWHIATDLCYYSDLDDIHRGDFEKYLVSKCRISKCLSDYILYVLVFNPSMLPEGIGEIRYRDMVAEALRFFMDEEVSDSVFGTYKKLIQKYITKSKACKDLLEVNFGAVEEAKKGDKSQSLLFYGCRLVNQLKSLQIDHKWEVISEVWVEMLTYTSNKCRWKEHVRSTALKRRRATHSCSPSYGASWLKQTISNPEDQIRCRKCKIYKT
ncbi:hypothetical protein EZV62_003531 [Acer yangbiense]|uniref:DUF4220 domain-containing protein n=1 Tax=Acer yangbiense TaxID=1000413 RepID=A0A5C7IJG6_9ROSI|nr:hypothetical protein EZV62_003531 [Acer yangbiense]